MNISYRLRELFFAWLERLEYERTHRVETPSYASHRSPSFVPNINRMHYDDKGLEGVVYFYEWSNATAVPRTFYTLKALQDFFDKSMIYPPSYQWELIKHIYNPYVACKKDSKELIIKTSWDALKEALEEDNGHKGSEDKEPYNVRITRVPMANQEPKILNCKIHSSAIQKPPMYAEVDNRYPDMEQIGDWWG
jgi:hypothetical protein